MGTGMGVDTREAATAETARAARTRAALVDVVLARLRSDGAFTTEQVATDAEVSVATVYNRFPDGRDGLLAAAFDRSLTRVVAAGDEPLTVEHLLDHGLEATLAAFVEGLAGAFAEEALVFRAALARLSESRAIRDAYRSHEAGSRAVNRRFVELGQAAGRISGGDPEELADLLLVVGQGVNNPVLLGAVDRGPLCAHLTAALFAVLSPEDPR